jgi:hypothetical protein
MVHLGGQLAVDLREFLNGLAGGIGQGGDIGGEDIEVIAVTNNAGGGDAGIDGNDPHHLDGPAQVRNRRIGGGNHFDQTSQIGLFLPERVREQTGAFSDSLQMGQRFLDLGALQRLGQCLEEFAQCIEQHRAFRQAGPDSDKGGFNILPRAGEIICEPFDRDWLCHRHTPPPDPVWRPKAVISAAILPSGNVREAAPR